ncbi:MAG TPA: hypothetical protein VNA14_12730 [Mycobacteriales bacterium]|nr:hypothetical protein [Mycobacteriales bacterium]
MEPLRTAAHRHNGGYLRTEEKRLDHLDTAGEELEPARIATPNGDSKWINDEEGVPCRTRCGTATR